MARVENVGSIFDYIVNDSCNMYCVNNVIIDGIIYRRAMIATKPNLTSKEIAFRLSEMRNVRLSEDDLIFPATEFLLGHYNNSVWFTFSANGCWERCQLSDPLLNLMDEGVVLNV